LTQLAHLLGCASSFFSKFTVTNPAIGGAKAGIRYDFTKPDAQDVLRRFIQFYKPLLQSTWVTAGDFGTDDGFIERTIQEMGLTCCQHALGKKVAQDLKSEDLSYQLAKLISHPANNSFPLIEACVGNGVAQSINMVSTISGMVRFSPQWLCFRFLRHFADSTLGFN
jgi:hypothetical protein